MKIILLKENCLPNNITNAIIEKSIEINKEYLNNLINNNKVNIIYLFENKLESEYLIINNKNSISKICFDEILFIEAMNHKCGIYTKNSIIFTNSSLNSLKENITHSSFIQTHRSYIVNMDMIDTVLKSNSSWSIKFKDSCYTAYIGPSFKKKFLEVYSLKNLK